MADNKKEKEYQTIEVALFDPGTYGDEIEWQTIGRASDEEEIMEERPGLDEEIYYFLEDDVFDDLVAERKKPGSILSLDEDFLLVGTSEADDTEGLLDKKPSQLKEMRKNALAQQALKERMAKKIDFRPVEGAAFHQKGWHNEPVNHALASKGIKVGKSRTKR
jgi:hypothetical protein